MVVGLLLLVFSAPLAVAAQGVSPASPPPQILTTASAEVLVRPDRAALSFTVESRAATAAKAGAETARRQNAVLDTLHALGVAAEQIVTASIEINPETAVSGPNKPVAIVDYMARNMVRVDVLKIEQTGMLIDAALAKGATGIGSLVFTSSTSDEARRKAIEMAVSKARNEAEIAARAAGGTISGLLELSIQPAYDRPTPMTFQRMQLSASEFAGPTPVNPGELKVSATITSRWGFDTGRRE